MKLLIAVLVSAVLAFAGDRVLDLERQYRAQIRLLEPEGSTIALSNALNGLAALYFEQGDFVRARRLSERAVEVEMESEDPRELEIARRIGNVGAALAGQGKLREAEPLVNRAMETFGRLGATYEQAFALNTLGTIELRRKDAGAALRHFESAVELWRDYPADRVRGMANVATALTALRRSEAIAMWVRTIDEAERENVSERERGVMLCGYADALARSGRKVESAEHRRRGREMMRAVVGTTVDRSDFR